MSWVQQLQAANWDRTAGCAIGAYVLGCFATGYYLVRARLGKDIREIDSGNIGARNVSRVLGKTGFILTLLGDFAKGALAVWVAQRFVGTEFSAGLAMLFVVVGHVWPAQLGFRGGKGVATSLGALVVCDNQLALAYAIIFFAAFLVTWKTILPGLFAYACLPLVCYWLSHDWLKTVMITTLAAIVLFAHRRNFIEELPGLTARIGANAKPEHPKL